MAIYHLDVRGVSRARGSSSVRSAAYQSGETLLDERTGERCDYARKERVVASGIELPDGAPPALSDRSTLWNAAERCVEGKALSARRIEFALPRELDGDERLSAVRDMAAMFTAQGRAVDWAVHDAGDGNPHAHMLVTGLPISMEWDGRDPESAFARPQGPRTEKCYLLRNALGEERFVPSGEWKAAKAEGWSKVFRYRVGDGEERMTQAQAADLGLSNADRASKQPVSKAVRLGGGSDFDAAKDELRGIRAEWARVANAALAAHAERTGGEAVTIDHRSNADRGVETLPTLHLGPKPSASRVEDNERIIRLNELITAAVDEIARLTAIASERASAWWRSKADRRRSAALSRNRAIAARAATSGAKRKRPAVDEGMDSAETRRADPLSVAREAAEVARRMVGRKPGDGPSRRR